MSAVSWLSGSSESGRRKQWIAPILHEMITTSLSSSSSKQLSSSLGLNNSSDAAASSSIESAESNMITFDNNKPSKGTGLGAARNSSYSIISQVLLSPIVASSSPSPALPFYDLGDHRSTMASTPVPIDVLIPEEMAALAGNGTLSPFHWPIRDPLYIVIPITIIYFMILITGILGNIVTCVVIVRSRYLHTATNYYLFSLAISDLLLLLSGLPAEMHQIWRRYPDVFGEVFCIAKGLASETSANATVLTIAAFTVERYLAICKPFLIQKWQNKLSRVVRQILVIWVISIALAVPQALQLGLVSTKVSATEETMICNVKRVIIEHSFEIATFLFFVGPMLLITVLYCLIGYTLYHSSHVNESKLRLRKSLSSHKREAGQQRVLKMLVAVVVAFFVCWAPFHAQRLIATWGATWLESSTTLKTAYHILIYISGVLYYVSTCINPILYHIMSLKFRHAFQVMVEGACSDSFGMGESNRRSQEQNFLRGVFPDRASQSTSRSSRSTIMNGHGHHALTEITPTSFHGKLCKSLSQSNGGSGSTWQQSLHAQYPYYPQRINFVQPSIATIV